MGTDLELRQVLERILEGAVHLVGAQFGVLSLVTSDRTITEFIPFGLPQDGISRIGRLPTFGGVLGLLFESERPVRIGDVASRPNAVGFPTHHPMITTLMGVAIRLRGETSGLLYLGNKKDDGEFTANDEEAVVAFARAAGIAIENSRLLAEQVRRERWLEAGAEVSRLLLSDVDRDEALHLVIRRLREVSGADSGVIALIDPSGSERFVFRVVDGIDVEEGPDQVKVSRPSFFASVLDSGKPIVTNDLLHDGRFNPIPAVAKASAGFGLAMFMPLVASGRVLGVLTLAWRQGSPSEQVAAREVSMIEAFADQAALTLRQLQAQEEGERRARWLEAGARMTRMLLHDVDRDEAMRLVTQTMRAVSGADYAGVLLCDVEHPGNTVLAVIEGLGLDHTAGTLIGRRGLIDWVLETGRPFVSDDLTHEEGYDPPDEWREPLSVVGLGILMPLVVGSDVLGVLYTAWRRDSPHTPAARREVGRVEAFANQAALALQRVQSQEDQARLRVLEDRDRIAQDLHDVVLQRLFAVEMRLQSATGLSKEPEVKQRVDKAIDELDDITREVRTSIFHLHQDDSGVESMRHQLLDEIDTARARLGFTPRLVIRGPVENRVPAAVQGELVPAVRDALASAAAHASATSVEVSVRVTGDQLVLTVHDDGADLGGSAMAEAVADLESRAQNLGGSCDITSGAKGTVIEWHVPLAS